MRFVSAAWVGLALSYLLFAGQVSRNELIAGLGSSLAVVLYAAIAHRVTESQMRLRLRWDLVARYGIKSLAGDTVKVGMALLRPESGEVVHTPLPVADPALAGRRAVAILSMSVAPNGYVVRMDGEQALLHQLVPSRPRQPPA